MNKSGKLITETKCPRCGEKEYIKKGVREQVSTGKKVPIYQCKTCNYKFTPEQSKKAQVGKKHQTGRTNVLVDKGRPAKSPGHRIVKHEDGTVTTYDEWRINRTDIDPKKML